MTIQSLTYQWQEAAIRGYDPNRHGLENPETERAKDIRNRLHNKERFEQNFGEYARKSRDGALDFERADHMAATNKYSAETMALYKQVEQEYEKFSNTYSDEYLAQMRANAADQKVKAQANYNNLLQNGIDLKNGNTVWYDQDQDLFFDKDYNQATTAEDKEARQALDHAQDELSEATEFKAKVESWVDRKEALDQRWEDIQDLKGKIPDEEYKKLLEDFSEDQRKLADDAPNAEKRLQVDNSYNNSAGQASSSAAIDDQEEPDVIKEGNQYTDDFFGDGIRAEGIDPKASFNYAAVLPPPPPPESTLPASPGHETQANTVVPPKPIGYT